MDKRPRSHLGRNNKVESLLEGLRTGSLSFNEFEHLFLDFIASDFETAGKLAEGLKHRRFPLSPHKQAHRLRLIGLFFEARSNHKLAISWTRKALDAFRELNTTAGVHQCLRLLFSSNVHLGRYKTARHYAAKALEDPSLPHGERIKMHSNLGGLAYRLHDYATSLEEYFLALNLMKDQERDKTHAVLLYNIGLVYVCLNKFAEAEENFGMASELFRKFRQDLYHAHTLQSFGNLYTILGQYFQAESKLKDAREIYLTGGDNTGASLCDVELIRLDTRLNRFERILDRMPTLIEAFRKKGRSTEMGMIFYSGIAPAIALREYDLAEDYLTKAMRIFKKEDNQHFIANCKMLQGVLLWHEGKRYRGLEKIRSAREAFAQTGVRELEMACLIYSHRIQQMADDSDTFNRVRTLLKHPLSPGMRSQGLILLSDYWYMRGQIKRSISVLFEAVNILEESRASISNQALRTSFFEDKAEVYELLIERLLEWKNPEASLHVFRAMELSRSRQMMELLSRREALPPVINQNDPLLMELHRLDLRIKQLNRKLEQLSNDAEAAKVDKETVLTSISETRGEIIKVRKAMRHEDRLSLFYPLEFRPEDIRRYLAPNHLLVLYYLGKKTLYRIELNKQILKTYQNPLPDNFNRDFNQMLNIISNRIVPKMGKAMHHAEQFSAVMMPKNLDSCTHVTFILHKTLQRFPLPLLKRPDGRYLLETHTLHQCPNLPVFYFTQRKHSARLHKPVFFFSNSPEDPAAPERTFMLKKFPEAQVIHSLSDPSVEKSLKQGTFIHFAGHCVFDKRNPDHSFLQLGGHKMSLSSFAKLGFDQQPFLNLAACSSGWMALSAGNEPHGFVIGSFAAGANSLLAGLWELDDEATGLWMEKFYAHIEEGLAAAYRKACLNMIQQGHDPYLWAGFCLLGHS